MGHLFARVCERASSFFGKTDVNDACFQGETMEFVLRHLFTPACTMLKRSSGNFVNNLFLCLF